MKHINNYDNHRKVNKELALNEKAFAMDNDYMVVTTVSVPKSFINAYSKKVKDLTGKDLKEYFGEQTIAEELVRFVSKTFMDVDQLPVNALIGGEDPQAQTQSQAQVQPQGQAQGQAQGEEFPQGQAQTEPIQGQAQPQVQVQPQGQAQPQVQVQTQSQGQAQPQGQSQSEYENIQDDEEEENDELPI